MKTKMRITEIALDDGEMPLSVCIWMTWDVWDQVCRDHRENRRVQPGHTYFLDGTVEHWWSERFPIWWVAKMARFYGRQMPDGGAGTEIYRCLSQFCNRFWCDGVVEASRQWPVPASEKERRGVVHGA